MIGWNKMSDCVSGHYTKYKARDWCWVMPHVRLYAYPKIGPTIWITDKWKATRLGFKWPPTRPASYVCSCGVCGSCHDDEDMVFACVRQRWRGRLRRSCVAGAIDNLRAITDIPLLYVGLLLLSETMLTPLPFSKIFLFRQKPCFLVSSF